MKELVNQRFIECVNYLLESRIEPNKAQISLKLTLKPSMFSEILNKRVNVNVEHIITLCSRWSFFSSEWLLTGKGEMIKESQQEKTKKQAVTESNEISKENPDLVNSSENDNKTVQHLNELLEFKQDKIMRLEKEIQTLKSKIEKQ